MAYAWIIDVDHMPDLDRPEGTNSNAKGVVGPRDAPDWMEKALKERHGARELRRDAPGAKVITFRIYDSDEELYYTGRLIVDGDDVYKCPRCDGTKKLKGGVREGEPCIVCDRTGMQVSEEACIAPLEDFGRPNAGATEVRYQGHKEMDIG